MNGISKFSMALLLGALAFSPQAAAGQGALERMISPVANPVNFEDPRIQTSVRPIYMYHKAPGAFVTGAGDIQLWALQLRLALTDRLSFIATKDGYIKIDPKENLPESEGFANIAGGLQYAAYRDDTSILSLGLRYEAPTGESEVFQGEGDGIISPHISAAKAFDAVNVMAFSDLRLGVRSADTDFWDVGLHFDLPIESFYPLVEFNMTHVIDAGNRIDLPHEGFDLVNFGSSQSEGSTVVTAAVGFRYRAADWLDVGSAYEFALTDREDIFDWRVTADLVFTLPYVLFE